MKTLFVWLLLLAVPFQGHAAAALNLCASGSATAAHTNADCHVAGLTHALSQDGQGVATAKAAPAAAADQCGHCTSCAAALSMPALDASLSFEPATADPIAYFERYSTNPLYDGLERPPHRRPVPA